MNNSPWQGRSDPSDNSRWHQVVEVTNKVEQDCHCIVGFNCDEGVRRNKGRAGAVAGPDQIRKMLSNLVYSSEKPIIDLGNIECIGKLLEDAQSNLASKLADVIKARSLPIILGGGHEVAWGTYQGIRKAHPKAKLGIINFDAHFDLRPLEPSPTSGTPFRQVALYNQEKNINNIKQ